jgi:hypothetical protein
VKSSAFLAAAREALGRDVEAELRPWLDRPGVPDVAPVVEVAGSGQAWRVTVRAIQVEPAWPLATAVAVEAGDRVHLFPMTLDGTRASATLTVPDRPRRVVFDALSDFPSATARHHAFSSFAEDFSRTLIVYGTARQLEANHTLALRFQAVLADAFSEDLPRVVQDAEVGDAELADHDLFVIGDPRDNALLARVLPGLPVEAGPGHFRFQGRAYSDERDGLYLAVPSPFAKARVLHLLLANSPLQLHEMTKTYRAGLPAWAVFRGEKPVREGHFPVERFELAVPGGPPDAKAVRGR